MTPQTVLDTILEHVEKHDVPINSLEGFIRQLIGWREYMYGMYLAQPKMMDVNFFGLRKELEDWWYTLEGAPNDLPVPVKHTLQKVHRLGYNHHIERLMILGSWFLLNQYNPKSVYHWFKSLYVDAYEWVMVPNVQGMSQYADGGMVATKPYISGGNYLQKMGSWWDNNQAAKDSVFTDLYWEFLKTHHDKLAGNPRMSLILAQAKKR